MNMPWTKRTVLVGAMAIVLAVRLEAISSGVEQPTSKAASTRIFIGSLLRPNILLRSFGQGNYGAVRFRGLPKLVYPSCRDAIRFTAHGMRARRMLSPAARRRRLDLRSRDQGLSNWVHLPGRQHLLAAGKHCGPRQPGHDFTQWPD